MIIEPKASVLVPMTISVADGASEIRVPLMVIAGPPGERVWLPTMNCEALFAVTGWLPMVRTDAAVGIEGGTRAFVLDPIMIAEADAASETSVSLIVIAGPPGERV